MDELSRIEIANELLEELYALCQDYSADKKIEIFYNFLVRNTEDTAWIDADMKKRHMLSQKNLNVYKKDAWIVILIDGYEYLRYSQSKQADDKCATILSELDSLEFTFSSLFEYMCNSDNEESVKFIIQKFYEYDQKGQDLAKLCRDYNYDNQTDFRNWLTAYIGNVEALDFMANIFSILDDKYQSQISATILGTDADELAEDVEEIEETDLEEETVDDEDFDNEEYKKAIDEMFDGHEDAVKTILENFQTELHEKITEFLEDYLDDKFVCDDFLGFFLSYVYMILIRKDGKLLNEEEVILTLLSNPNYSFPELVEPIYINREYLMSLLDTFCEYYYKNNCDILDHREKIDKQFDRDRIASLDPGYFDKGRCLDMNLINNPFNEIYDMIFMKYKLDYPDCYLTKIYEVLMSDTDYESKFYELGIEEDLMIHRISMIRYFSRKFMEMMYTKDIADVTNAEYKVLETFLKSELDTGKIIKIFYQGGIEILSGYEVMLEKTPEEEKEIVRVLITKTIMPQIIKVDPSILGDSIYYRAVVDSDLFRYLETNGISRTVQYLMELARADFSVAREFINEVMVSIYTHSKDKDKKDSIEQIIYNTYEIESVDIDTYIQIVFEDEIVLHQLLEKYYSNEREEDFPISYEDRVVKYPKIKRKLYPRLED